MKRELEYNGQFNNLNQLVGLGAAATTTVSGHTSAAVTSATVNTLPATVTNSTNFTANVPLPPGTNIVSVVAQPPTGAPVTQRVTIVTAGTTPSALTYDANGNTLTDEKGYAYTWDALNRLISILYPSGASSSFAYDGLSRRISIIEKNASGTVTCTKNYLWIGSEMAEERDGSNNVTKWFFPQGEQQAGTNYYYATDHLGSVREMLNSSGSIVARYSYDPSGVTTLIQGTNLATKQYAGMYLHQTSGLYLTKFRAFDANTGRWLSRDPIGENGGYNLYEYCIDDPERFIDPSGRMGALAAGGLIDLSLGGPENPIADVVAGGAIIIILGIDAATVDAVIHNQAQASSRPIDHVAPDISKIPIPNSLAECKKDGGQCEWRYAWCVHNRLDPTSNRSMWENYDCETQYQLCKAGHGWGGPWPPRQTWKTSKNVWPDKW